VSHTKAGPLEGAIATVGALITAFGGSLLLLAPPVRYPNIPKEAAATTMAVFAMLALVLIISAFVRRNPKSGRLWLLVAGVAFVAFLGTCAYYLFTVDRSSFVYPVVVAQPDGKGAGDSGDSVAETLERFVYGDKLASVGIILTKRFPDADAAELVRRAGGLDRINTVWTAESLDRARFRLTVVYVAILLFLALSVFSVVEGVFRTRRA
jgi:hypothetical protein